ncbi:uncharacterized protein B0I36DRAFT_142459 [Microdochium trichocladiopsis]|uniref:Uncharacterized protein n=1 Tax=Microdochium trichocladiopsis TaxID=1682393 RepID=A0A9P8Y2L5_9PEZI|nr:uncharacterized protein B0I36DRAFT_142459 [Microdochium trichocladiopsis]KAH7027724.1 hypothetical protein B0I36DRAFT_142459 [Microdochium trichocladiopsis]
MWQGTPNTLRKHQASTQRFLESDYIIPTSLGTRPTTSKPRFSWLVRKPMLAPFRKQQPWTIMVLRIGWSCFRDKLNTKEQWGVHGSNRTMCSCPSTIQQDSHLTRRRPASAPTSTPDVLMGAGADIRRKESQALMYASLCTNCDYTVDTTLSQRDGWHDPRPYATAQLWATRLLQTKAERDPRNACNFTMCTTYMLHIPPSSCHAPCKTIRNRQQICMLIAVLHPATRGSDPRPLSTSATTYNARVCLCAAGRKCASLRRWC